MTEQDAADPSAPLDFIQFFLSYAKARGALSTAIISLSIAFAIGCTVAIVPEILSDRYARLLHGFDGEVGCSSFDDETMPAACRLGADDAQASSAWSSLLANLLTLFLNPSIGRMSDVHGRRWIFVLCTFLYTLSPLVLVCMQVFDTMSPIYYYIASALVGAVSYMSITFAILTDTIPKEYRASSFGIIMAAFYGGYALSPSLALVLDKMHISVL